jgi:hypothetical protein
MGQKPFDVRYALTSCVIHFHTRVSREIAGKGNVEESAGWMRVRD